MIAPEADDVLRDHLLGGEMGAVEAGQVVTPEPRRGRDAVDEIIEPFRARPVIPREESALVRGERVTRPDPAQESRRRAEGDLGKIRPQSAAQPFAPRGPVELGEQLGGGNFLRLPAIEKRLLRQRHLAPAERDPLPAALESFDDAPGGLALRVFR